MTSAIRLATRADTKFANLIDSVDEAQSRVLSAQKRIKSIEEQARHLSDSEESEPQRQALIEEIERVTLRRNRAQNEFMSLSRVVTAIRTFLTGLPASAELFDAAPVRADPMHDSEAVEDGVARCQEEIAKLKVDRNAVMYSVPPIPDLYLAAHAHVQHLAQRGRPSVHADASGKLIIRHDSDNAFGGRNSGREDALAVAAWLAPDIMLQRLQEQIDAGRELELKRGVCEMSAGEKASELARIDERIMHLERQEEFFIEVGETYGMRIQRRDDASPLAILGLELGRRKRSAA